MKIRMQRLQDPGCHMWQCHVSEKACEGGREALQGEAAAGDAADLKGKSAEPRVQSNSEGSAFLLKGQEVTE